jgi:hypothetical protein
VEYLNLVLTTFAVTYISMGITFAAMLWKYLSAHPEDVPFEAAGVLNTPWARGFVFLMMVVGWFPAMISELAQRSEEGTERLPQTLTEAWEQTGREGKLPAEVLQEKCSCTIGKIISEKLAEMPGEEDIFISVTRMPAIKEEER